LTRPLFINLTVAIGISGLVDRFAACFEDFRCAELIEHEVATLIGLELSRPSPAPPTSRHLPAIEGRAR
jgi:hypothetical protein